MQLHAADTFQVGCYHVDDSTFVHGSLAALYECACADTEPLVAITTPVEHRLGGLDRLDLKADSNSKNG